MSLPPAAEALIKQISEGKAPPQARAAAARGVLPFPRGVLAHLFILLLDDPEEQVRTDAAASLDALDEDALLDILSEPDCTPEIHRHFAGKATRNESVAEKIVFHDSAPNEALEVLADKGSAAVIELILTNQERLLASPTVLDRLTVNPALRADQRGRLLELLERAASLTDPGTEAKGEADAIDPEEAARILDVDVGELYATSEILGGDEFEQAEEPEVRNAYRKILVLTTAQRAILAMKGGREERMILIRDTNKVVALSVLKNPRMPEGEVEGIAAMRNVSEDVLRAVGSNREWVKNYGVIHALIRNPRTPPGISTNFISRIMNRDLKMLAKDRNVPELVRRMAKRTLDTRLQKMGSSFKKR